MYFKGKVSHSDVSEGRTSRSLLKEIHRRSADYENQTAIKHLSVFLKNFGDKKGLLISFFYINQWKSPVTVCLLLSAFCWASELSDGFTIKALNQLNQTSYPQKIKDHRVPPIQGAFWCLKVLVQPVVASFYTSCMCLYIKPAASASVHFLSVVPCVCLSSLLTRSLCENEDDETERIAALKDCCRPRPLNSESLQWFYKDWEVKGELKESEELANILHGHSNQDSTAVRYLQFMFPPF